MGVGPGPSLSDEDTIIGEIMQADSYPEDYPESITITIRCTRDTRVGHWWVRMQRIEKPEGA